ncbi:MAG: hypothetical protein NZ602_05925, partial [Thermoguttaceae bacterium]|nr:hypothetical protein [Thermoguttaceae bacterium]
NPPESQLCTEPTHFQIYTPKLLPETHSPWNLESAELFAFGDASGRAGSMGLAIIYVPQLF